MSSTSRKRGALVFVGDFDFDYRPKTYWPVSPTRAELLSRVKGRVRRRLAEQALAGGESIRGAWVASSCRTLKAPKLKLRDCRLSRPRTIKSASAPGRARITLESLCGMSTRRRTRRHTGACNTRGRCGR